MTCIKCGERVSPFDPPRYDVLSEGFDPDDSTDPRGPYCEGCFAGTATGRATMTAEEETHG